MAEQKSVIDNYQYQLEAVVNRRTSIKSITEFTNILKKVNAKDYSVAIKPKFDDAKFQAILNKYRNQINAWNKDTKNKDTLKKHEQLLKEIDKIEAKWTRQAISNRAAEEKKKAKLEEKALVDKEKRLSRENQLEDKYRTKKIKTNYDQDWLSDKIKDYFSIYAAQNFLKTLFDISNQFEVQKKSLGALIQDQSKAIVMFNQIKNMALQSPYTTLDITANAKQLSAYGVSNENLLKDTKMLSDIAAGTGVDMSRLTLAYGQVKAAEFLRGQEARQFTEAGVPIIDALAKKYSALEGHLVTMGDVYDRISKRQVSFKDVSEALANMTEEGGKFYKMQETIVETNYGKLQKLSDIFQQTLASLGNENKGIITFALDAMVKLVRNLKTIASMAIWGLLAKYASKPFLSQKNPNDPTRYSARTASKFRDWVMYDEEYYQSKEGKGFIGKNFERYDSADKRAKRLLRIREEQKKLGREYQKNHKLVSRYSYALTALSRGTRVAALSFVKLGRAMKAAFLSNPVGIILTIVSSLVGLVTSLRQADKEMKEIESNSKGEIGKLTSNTGRLFKEYDMHRATKDSEAYKNVLTKIAQTYGDVLPAEMTQAEYLDRLIEKYGDATKAAEEYNNAIRNQLTGKMYEDQAELKKSKITISPEDVKKYLEHYGIKTTDENISYAYEQITAWQNGGSSSEFNKNMSQRFGSRRIDYSYDYDALGKIDKDFRVFGAFKNKSEEALFGPYRQGLSDLETKVLDIQKAFDKSVPEKYGDVIESSVQRLTKEYNELIGATGPFSKYALTQEQVQKILENREPLEKILTEEQKKHFKITQQLLNATEQFRDTAKNSITHFSLLTETGKDFYNWLVKSKNILPKIALGMANIYTEGGVKNSVKANNEAIDALVNENVYSNLAPSSNPKNKDALNKIKNIAKEAKKRAIEDRKKGNTDDTWYNQKAKELRNIAGGKSQTAKELADIIEKAGSAFASELYSVTEEKTSGSKRKENFQEIVSTLAEARKRYVELRDTMSESGAFDRTKFEFTKLFDGISAKFKQLTGDTLDFSIIQDRGFDGLIKYIETIAKKEPELKQLVADLKQAWGLNKQNIDKAIKDIFSAFDIALNKYRGRINLYDAVFGKTKNDSLSQMVASSFYGNEINLRELTLSRFRDIVEEQNNGGQADVGGLVQGVLDLIDAGKSWIEINNKINELPEKTREEVLKLSKVLQEESENIVKRALTGYNMYQDVVDKYSEINREIDTIKSKLENDTNIGAEEKNAALTSLEKERKQRLAEVELESIKTSEMWIDSFENIENAGVETLIHLKKQLEIYLSNHRNILDPPKLKEINKEIEKIDDRIRPTRSGARQGYRNLFSRKTRRANDEELARLEQGAIAADEKAQMYEGDDSLDDEFKKMLRDDATEAQQIYENKKQQIENQNKGAIEDIEYWSSMASSIWDAVGATSAFVLQLTRMNSKMNNRDLSNTMVNTATIFAGGAQAFSSLAGISKNTKTAKENKDDFDKKGEKGIDRWAAGAAALGDLSGVLTANGNAGQAVSSIGSVLSEFGASTGLPELAAIGGVVSAIGAISDAVVKVHNNNIDNSIDKLKDSLEDLEQAMQGINNEMRELAGNEYFDAMGRKVENLRKQLENAEEQLALERQKTKPDPDEVKQYEKAVTDAQQRILDAQQEMFQYMLGTDIKGYLEGIVKTFVDARNAGTSTFNALKQSFGEMVSSMIEKTIMSSIIKKRFQSLFDEITAMAESGEMTSGNINSLIAQGLNSIQLANNDLTAYYPAIKAVRNAFNMQNSTGGLTAGVQGMSEQTAGTLAGYFSAGLVTMNNIQYDVSQIKSVVVSGTNKSTTMSITSEMATNYLNKLVSIDANTRLTVSELQSVNRKLDKITGTIGVDTQSRSGVIYGFNMLK